MSSSKSSLQGCCSDDVAVCQFFFYFLNSKLFSFKSKSAANEAPSGSESSSTSSAAKIRVMNHKDYKTWKVRATNIYP